MFLLIPLLLIVGSCVGIAVIVYRKLPYLKKLTPESHEVGETVFHDFFPELLALFNEVKFKEYQKLTLMELEKLLRRMRLVSLKVDHLSERMIKKVRKAHVSTHMEIMAEDSQTIEPASAPTVVKTYQELVIEELKNQEQQLIMSIAHNPKDFQLYENLGDLYLKMDNAYEAKESFEAALALNPADTVLVKKYSSLLKTMTTAESAIK